MNENQLREKVVEIGRSLYERGLAHGSAGNISVKIADGWLMTPTNSSTPHAFPGSTRMGSSFPATSPQRKRFFTLPCTRSVPPAARSCTCIQFMR